MQHLGEICMAQRSRGKSKQNKNHVKPRKEIQKRSFWRRFFSSFLSLLKEKRPPEAKRGTDSHVASLLGMTGKERGVCSVDVRRGGVLPRPSLPPSRRSRDTSLTEGGGVFRACGRGGAMWASPPTDGLSRCSLKTAGGAEPLPYGQVQGVRPCNGRRGVVTPPYGQVQGSVAKWRKVYRGAIV